jgi:hypothetical protein
MILRREESTEEFMERRLTAGKLFLEYAGDGSGAGMYALHDMRSQWANPFPLGLFQSIPEAVEWISANGDYLRRTDTRSA